MASPSTSSLMRVLGVRSARTTYPTGNPSFSVKQAFPAAFDETESDPFLMCDYFGPSKTLSSSKNDRDDPDKFPVNWHPHRGMDICSYLKEGVGRHADSLGNRGTYATPGMQWISVGSGIEHAEGGGTPEGMNTTGFQIWINVPAKHKMDDPDYGTIAPDDLPYLTLGSNVDEELKTKNVTARLLAGEYLGHQGPFRTKQPLQMIDYELVAQSSYKHSLPNNLDNCIVYVYHGAGLINQQSVQSQNVLRLDAQSPGTRDILLQTLDQDMRLIIFAGKRINEPIAWQGPFVMNTQEQLQQTFAECRRGEFPPKRVPWDYKKISAFPKEYFQKNNKAVNAETVVTEEATNQVDTDRSQCL